MKWRCRVRFRSWWIRHAEDPPWWGLFDLQGYMIRSERIW